MRFRSLKSLMVIFLAVFLSVTWFTAYGIYNSTLATIDRLVGQRIGEISAEVLPIGARLPPEVVEGRIRDLLQTRQYGDVGFVFSRNGQVLIANVTPLRPLPAGMARLDDNDGIAGLSHGLALTRVLPDGQRLSVLAETERIQNLRPARLRIYMVGFGSITVIAVAATLVFGLTIRSRLMAMQQTVDAIMDGDLSRRVPTDGSGSEFDQQAEGFNRVLNRVEALMAELRHISSGVAHELRTPLARLRNQLNLLANDPASEEVRPQVELALSQADLMLELFSALLRLAEVEGGERRRAFVPTDLAQIGARCAEELAPVAEAMGQKICVTLEGAAPVLADPQLLRQALFNLVENAMRHTPSGTCIRVSAGTQGERGFLRVSDDGPGIPVEDLPKALSRFGRLKPTASKGHGLGLPLVGSIAKLHGGEMTIGDAALGLTVILYLPSLSTA